MINSIMKIGNEKLTKKEMIKLAAGIAVNVCADLTITALMAAHMPVGTGIRKVIRWIGMFAIGMKVGEDAENYFYKVYDETCNTMKEVKDELETAANDNSEGAAQA